MIPHDKDPGLQPERTSLAWLRTYMLIIGLGILLFKVGKKYNDIYLQINALVLFAFSAFFYYRNKKRFTYLLNLSNITGDKEALIKKLLSLLIFSTAIIYAISSIIMAFR